jgi:hypothetical protein
MKADSSKKPFNRLRFRFQLLRTELFISFSLALICVATFWQCLGNELVNYDDDIYPQNFNVQNGLQIEYLLWAFTAKTMNQWHPLTWISLQLDTEILGTDPMGYHCTNLLLHALNTVLLFWLLRIATNRVYPSAVVAALFSIHPLHVESVAWVTARKDVLSTFFMLLTLLFYVKYARKPALGTYLTMVCFFLLGLLAKPMPVTLPLIMLLFDYWPLHRTRLPEPNREQAAHEIIPAPRATSFRLMWEKLPLFAIALLAGMTILPGARQEGGEVRWGIRLTHEERLKCAVIAATTYLRDTFWPSDLAVFYPIPDRGFSVREAVFSLAILTAITLVAVSFARTRPYLLVGWLFYLIALFPATTLVHLESYAKADRNTYVPLIGIFMALAWGASDLSNLNRLTARLAVPLTFSVIAICTVLSCNQVHYWHDSTALWEKALVSTEENYFTHMKLAQALLNEERKTEAREHFLKAVSLRPDISITHLVLGMNYLADEEYEQAIHCFRTAVSIEPGFDRAQNKLDLAIFLKNQ